MESISARMRYSDVYGEKELDNLAFVFALSNSLLICKNIIIAGNAWLASHNNKINILILIFSCLLYLSVLVQLVNIKIMNVRVFLFCIVILLFWCSTYIISPEIFALKTISEELQNFIIYCLPAIIFLPMLKDCNALMNNFYKFRWLMLFCTVISVLQMLIRGQIQGTSNNYAVYNMAFGRALMLPTILFFSKWFFTWKFRELVCGIFCVISIFLFASRFPLLCVITYIFVKVWKMRENIKVRITMMFGGVIIISVIFFYKKICVWLYNVLNATFGINSRALLLIINGYFSYDSGRIDLFKQLIPKINESPIWGYGIGGSNIILNDSGAHSFILDVFATMGYCFGGIFLLISTIYIIQLCKRNKSYFNQEFIIICICMFLPICAIQTSMWDSRYYWYLIAMCFGRLRDRGIGV